MICFCFVMHNFYFAIALGSICRGSSQKKTANSLHRAVVFSFVCFVVFIYYLWCPLLLSFLFDFSNNCRLNPTRATYLTRESKKKNMRHVLLRENKALSRSTWLPYYDVIQSTDLDTEPRQRHNHFDHCPPPPSPPPWPPLSVHSTMGLDQHLSSHCRGGKASLWSLRDE